MNLIAKWTAGIGTASALVAGVAVFTGALGDAKAAVTSLFDLATVTYVDTKVGTSAMTLASDIADAHKLLKTLGNMTADSNVGQFEIRLQVARSVLRDAERDLANNPNIVSLQRLVAEAEAEVEHLEVQVKLALCYRTEIISEQPQNCRLLDVD